MKRPGGVFLALLLLPALAAAEEKPSVEAKATKTDVTVGETFGVELVASGPEGTVWSFPPEPGSEKVELRTPPPATAAGSAAPAPPIPDRHRYEAAAFAVGEAEVPPVTVKYRLPDGTEGEVASAAIPLRIVSVLPKDPKEQKLADIRPPVPLGPGREFWIALAALLLLGGGLVAWLLRRRRRGPEAAAAAPEVPPDVEARAALDHLRKKGLPGRGEFRSYYIELTEVAKRYLERRLGAPVLEMTSAEMVSFLRESAAASDFALAMRDLAGAADRIKFAKGSGLGEEADRHLDGVKSMIVAVELKLRPAPGEAKAGEGKAA